MEPRKDLLGAFCVHIICCLVEFAAPEMDFATITPPPFSWWYSNQKVIVHGPS